MPVWHGHGPNTTGNPRRSVPGAFIRRDAKPETNFASHIHAETLETVSHIPKLEVRIQRRELAEQSPNQRLVRCP